MATKAAKPIEPVVATNPHDARPEIMSLDEIRARSVAKTVGRMKLCGHPVARRRLVFEYPCGVEAGKIDYLSRSRSGKWYRICSCDVPERASLDPETGHGWREIETPWTILLLDSAASAKLGTVPSDDADDDAVLTAPQRVKRERKPKAERAPREKKERVPRAPSEKKVRDLSVLVNDRMSVFWFIPKWRTHRVLAGRDLSATVYVSASFVAWAVDEAGGNLPASLVNAARTGIEKRSTILSVEKKDAASIAALRAFCAAIEDKTDLAPKRQEWLLLLAGQLRETTTATKPVASKKRATATKEK